jgi:hypothetical protein
LPCASASPSSRSCSSGFTSAACASSGGRTRTISPGCAPHRACRERIPRTVRYYAPSGRPNPFPHRSDREFQVSFTRGRQSHFIVGRVLGQLGNDYRACRPRRTIVKRCSPRCGFRKIAESSRATISTGRGYEHGATELFRSISKKATT